MKNDLEYIANLKNVAPTSPRHSLIDSNLSYLKGSNSISAILILFLTLYLFFHYSRTIPTNSPCTHPFFFSNSAIFTFHKFYRSFIFHTFETIKKKIKNQTLESNHIPVMSINISLSMQMDVVLQVQSKQHLIQNIFKHTLQGSALTLLCGRTQILNVIIVFKQAIQSESDLRISIS